MDGRVDADCLCDSRRLCERPRQLSDGRQQLPTMSDGDHAEFFKVIARQLGEDLAVDLIVAERRLVFAESKATQPFSHVHSHVPNAREDDRSVRTECLAGWPDGIAVESGPEKSPSSRGGAMGRPTTASSEPCRHEGPRSRVTTNVSKPRLQDGAMQWVETTHSAPGRTGLQPFAAFHFLIVVVVLVR